jgi:hypothetical protein
MRRGAAGRLIIMASGAVALAGSFFPFYTFERDPRLTVWHRGLFPLATMIAITCVLASLETAISMFAGRRLPSPVLSFTWEQIHLAIGCFATIVALAYLLQYRGNGNFGTGYFLLLGAAVGTLVGAIVEERARLLERAPAHDTADGLAPPEVDATPAPDTVEEETREEKTPEPIDEAQAPAAAEEPEEPEAPPEPQPAAAEAEEAVVEEPSTDGSAGEAPEPPEPIAWSAPVSDGEPQPAHPPAASPTTAAKRAKPRKRPSRRRAPRATTAKKQSAPASKSSPGGGGGGGGGGAGGT